MCYISIIHDKSQWQNEANVMQCHAIKPETAMANTKITKTCWSGKSKPQTLATCSINRVPSIINLLTVFKITDLRILLVEVTTDLLNRLMECHRFSDKLCHTSS